MKLNELPLHIQPLLNRILKAGYRAWLIGSRVNETNKQPNDWDILIFGDEELFKELQSLQPIDDLDILVVFNGDQFESPWPCPNGGETKKGSLKSWKWTELNSNTATYEGTKWPVDWGSPKNATRILL